MKVLNKILFIFFTILIFVVLLASFAFLSIDPNKYKSAIVDSIETNTGYQANINSELSWHIWPKVSLISGDFKITNPATNKPILDATNLRLDVDFLSLFTKQIVIKNAFIEGATINLINKKEVLSTKINHATINHTFVKTAVAENPLSFPFIFNSVEIKNSQLFFKHEDKLVSIRDVNLFITKNADNSFMANFDAEVNRDLQTVKFNGKAKISINEVLEQVKFDISKLNYHFQKNSIESYKGELSSLFTYDHHDKKLIASALQLKINNNVVEGYFSAIFNEKPFIRASLIADDIDLGSLIHKQNHQGQVKTVLTNEKPIAINTDATQKNELAFLSKFDADIKLLLENLQIDKVNLEHIALHLNVNNEVATLKQFDFNLASGRITSQGIAKTGTDKNEINFSFIADSLDLNSLLSQIDLTNQFDGKLNAHGTLSASTLLPHKNLDDTLIDFSVQITPLTVNHISLTDLINRSLNAQKNDEAIASTLLESVSANVLIKDKQLILNDIIALNNDLILDGNGLYHLESQQIDSLLYITLNKNNQKSIVNHKVIDDYLYNTKIPLHIFGSKNELQYKIDVDLQQIIRQLLRRKSK